MGGRKGKRKNVRLDGACWIIRNAVKMTTIGIDWPLLLFAFPKLYPSKVQCPLGAGNMCTYVPAVRIMEVIFMW